MYYDENLHTWCGKIGTEELHPHQSNIYIHCLLIMHPLCIRWMDMITPPVTPPHDLLKRSGGKSEVPKSSLGRREKCR
jgi:hypothetical protein